MSFRKIVQVYAEILIIPVFLIIILGVSTFRGKSENVAAVPQMQQTQLYKGWNMVAYPGETMSIELATASIKNQLRAVWYYDSALRRWFGYSPSVPSWANDLKLMTKGKGYQISVTENVLWLIPLSTTTPSPPQPTITLTPTPTTVPAVNIYYPDRVAILAGTVVSGDYTSLRADDAVDSSYLKIQAALINGSYYVGWYGETTMPPGQVSQLTVTYDGHYSKWIGQNIYIYDFVSASWYAPFGSSKTVFVVDLTVTATIGPALPGIPSTDPLRYISPEGKVRALVTASSTVPFEGYGDFIKLTLVRP